MTVDDAVAPNDTVGVRVQIDASKGSRRAGEEGERGLGNGKAHLIFGWRRRREREGGEQVECGLRVRVRGSIEEHREHDVP